jgi:D-serine dehydratase
MPVVEQIKKVFGQNYIELDSDGSALLKQEQQKIAKLESDLSLAHAKIMESEDRLEKSATFLLISEKTKGLNESEIQRVAKMFKNKKFDEVKETIDDFVSIVKESKTFVPKSESKGTMEEVITEDDHIEDAKPSVNEEREEFTFAEKANRYLSE